MSGYGTVPQTDPEEGGSTDGVPRDASYLPGWFCNFIKGSPDDAHTARRLEEQTRAAASDTSTTIEIDVSPEAWRFIAYVFFWLMCLFAILLSKFVVAPLLAAGPGDGSTCPPFDDGKGFDIVTNSHLNRIFGFNNICVNWDYSPSRELTAMVYPLFEYSLLIYIFLDFTNSAISYKKGYVSKRFWTLQKIFFPIEVVLCAWFRMIFVMLAYVNVQGHTAGFLGLQIALVMVTVSNVYYILATNTVYDFLGGVKGTRLCARVYLVGDLLISAVKVYLTAYVVFSGSYPGWAKAASGIPGKNVGQIIDIVWMVFNAVLPVFISFMRAKTEKPLKITIDLGKAPAY